MLCPNCMSELPDGSRRCRHCSFDFARWSTGPGAGRRTSPRGKPVEDDELEEARPRRRLRKAVILLAFLAILGLAGFWWLAPAAALFAQRGLIAFVSRSGGNAEIMVMEANRLQPRRLTDHPAADTNPTVSPDQTRVAFVSERDGNPEIYVVNADGSGLRRLTSAPSAETDPAWSPSGAQLAVVSGSESSAPEILLVRPDGGTPVNLTQNEAADSDPSWSPGGTKLAFVSTRDGDPEIYTVLADGSNLQRITHDPASDSEPVWSPDGNSLAFVSSRGCVSASPGMPCGDLFVMSAEGNRVQKLTEAARAGRVRSPVWSPDGFRIAVTSVSGSAAGERTRVLVAKPDDPRLEQVGPDGASSPAWSPDSRALAFVASPTQGRVWFRTRPYSGARRLCMATLDSRTSVLSWAVSSV